MASTLSTIPGIISFRIFSIPFFRVNVEEGQPLHAPCSTTFNILFLESYFSKAIFPPSEATAGLT